MWEFIDLEFVTLSYFAVSTEEKVGKSLYGVIDDEKLHFTAVSLIGASELF